MNNTVTTRSIPVAVAALAMTGIALAQQAAPSCTRIEYAELKEMRQERLQRELCGVRRTEGTLLELHVNSFVEDTLRRHTDFVQQIKINMEACKSEAIRITEIAAGREIKLDLSPQACQNKLDTQSMPGTVSLGLKLSEHYKSSFFSNSWSGTYTIPPGPLVKLQLYAGGVLYASNGATFSSSMGTVAPIAGVYLPNDPSLPVRIFWKDHTAGTGGAIHIGVQQHPRSAVIAE